MKNQKNLKATYVTFKKHLTHFKKWKTKNVLLLYKKKQTKLSVI